MSYLLFVIYFSGSALLISRLSLVRRTGLPIWVWLFFFTVKTATGCFYGYWYSRPERIGGSDSWRFHFEALQEYRVLLRDPLDYLSGLFHNGYNSWGGLLSPTGYWNDLKDNLMISIISLMDLATGGHYYVNVVIFSFITFFGYVFFAGACKNVLQATPGKCTTAIILFTPSCLFWTSGLHRDGFMLLFAGLFFWRLTLPDRDSIVGWRNVMLLALSFVGLFVFRSYVAIFLVPPVIAWCLGRRLRLKALLIFPVIIVICVCLVFAIPGSTLPERLIERKAAFEALQGGSRLPPLQLSATPGSFMKNLPAALERAFLRPHLWEKGSMMDKVAGVEGFLVVAVCLIACLRRGNAGEPVRRFQWLLISFSGGILLLIGYTIPFVGAIVRYRAMFTMFILVAASLHLLKIHSKYSNILNNESNAEKTKF